LPLAPARPLAPAAGSVCESAPEGVTTIERPMFPDRESSPTFGYSFKVWPGDPQAATIIYLPGGPGQAGIEAQRTEGYAPPTFTLIETDPRGVGCNAPPDPEYYPAEFYSSVHFADDVLAIVEALGLEDYLLYGISYGTLLGTVVASRAEARGLPPPRALVLEGVIGTTFSAERPAEAAFQTEWREVRDGLPEEIRSQFFADPLPLGLSGRQWGAGIQGMLPLGAGPDWGGVNFLAAALNVLAPGTPEASQNSIRDVVLALGESPVDASGLRLHHEVTCREITDEDFGGFDLVEGELDPVDVDCLDVELSAPFDAKDWPIRAPIYYFSGTDDTNTPPWQAQAHFAAQVAAPRQLVHVTAGGHNARAVNLVDCDAALWQAMASGAGFDAALGTCSWPTTLETGLPRSAR